jgi:hypothetical protein
MKINITQNFSKNERWGSDNIQKNEREETKARIPAQEHTVKTYSCSGSSIPEISESILCYSYY